MYPLISDKYRGSQIPRKYKNTREEEPYNLPPHSKWRVVVSSLLHDAARLGPYIIISLHGVLHAIIAPRFSLCLKQYPALSSTTIHLSSLITTTDFTIPSAASNSTIPHQVMPASSKAVPSKQSAGVSFNTLGANDCPEHFGVKRMKV